MERTNHDFRPNFAGENHQRDYHHENSHHRQYESDSFFNHQHHQMNGEQNDYFGSNNGVGGYGPGRKRAFNQATTSDHNMGGLFAKLFVAPVSRTATEEDICSIFGEHGHVIEVILPRDKRTGERQGYCFVKYATFEEAGRAIIALRSYYTFPGESAPLKVRYADCEKEYRGLPQDKLYVGCLNKHTTKKEIEEAFSPYGHVEDIYVLRNQFKENRGSAFVQYSRREMAVAAIKALHGVFFMRGCDHPLIVRFADPKKPRNGETRFVPNLPDAVPPYAIPNVTYPVQQLPTNLQPQGVSYWGNSDGAAPSVAQLPHPSIHQAPMQATQFPLQQMQIPQGNFQQQGNFQAAQQAVCEVQKQMPPSPSSSQNLGPKQNSHLNKIEAGSSQTIADPLAAFEAPERLEEVTPVECDWSEHTCPDGYKYYYNCVTCESRWDKPEELAIFENQLQKQQKIQNPSQQIHSCSQVHSTERVSKKQEEGLLIS